MRRWLPEWRKRRIRELVPRGEVTDESPTERRTTVGGVDVRLGQFPSGAAFRCTHADADPVVLNVSAVGEVVVRPREEVVVAHLVERLITGYEDAHEAAQRALDLAAYTRGVSLSLVRAGENFIQWWHEDGRPVVRIVLTREVGVTMSATASVTGPDGQIKHPDPPAVPAWTAALRFFRHAQLAEDGFDAYRNLFLALEAVLSERVTDGPAGERLWLEHALTTLSESGEIELTRYVAEHEPEDPVAAFLDEQYVALRCATFHAKAGRAGRGILLPGKMNDQETVGRAMERLGPMVVDLLRDVVGVQRHSGVMTYAGFEAFFIGPKVGRLQMELVRRTEGRVAETVSLDPGYLGAPPEAPGEYLFGGEVKGALLEGRTFDGVLVAAAGGEGLAAGPFEQLFDIHPIEVAGVDVVQVLLSFALNNLQLPKTRYQR